MARQRRFRILDGASLGCLALLLSSWWAVAAQASGEPLWVPSLRQVEREQVVAERVAKDPRLPEMCDKQAGLCETLTRSSRPAAFLAQHPGLDRIAAAHRTVPKGIARHPTAAQWLVRHPRLPAILAADPRALDTAVGKQLKIAEGLARHPDLDQILRSNQELAHRLASHPSVVRGLSRHPRFPDIAAEHSFLSQHASASPAKTGPTNSR